MDRINVSGLPAPVIRALEETVRNLRNLYRRRRDPQRQHLNLPRKRGKVVGSLSRKEIYGERA